MKPVGFDWDDRKASSNFAKHSVTFEEAMSVFDHDRAATRDDPDHSVTELREIIVGFRTPVSARLATSREQKLYEENRK